MKRLIVSADDLGLTGKVNEAIIEGHRIRAVVGALNVGLIHYGHSSGAP